MVHLTKSKTTSRPKLQKKSQASIMTQNKQGKPKKIKYNKKGKQMYYYKHGRKHLAKRRANLNNMLTETLQKILEYTFEGSIMVDKTILESKDYRKKYGLQTLAFVSKKFKDNVREVMFKVSTFRIHHFRLHPKHSYPNALKTLKYIRNLDVLWEPPKNEHAVTKDLSIDTLVSMKELKTLTIGLLAWCLEDIEEGDGVVELHRNILNHFNRRSDALPKWAKKVIMRGNLNTFKTYTKLYFTMKRAPSMSASTPVDRRVHCAIIRNDKKRVVNVEVSARQNKVVTRLTRTLLQKPKLDGLEGHDAFDRSGGKTCISSRQI